MTSPYKRVAVIGAGASGLCVSKYLIEAGFDVTIFEIGTQIGGLWCFRNDNNRSSCYRTLHINTSRGVTHFHDFDFDPSVQPFPDHRDMHQYLVAYADHFGVTPRIRFKTRVTALRPAFTPGKEAPKWRVETEAGDTDLFDTVVVCTGHLTKPLHVPLFQNDFKGEYVHSHDYREPEAFVGKRICVVGVGNSGCDIVSDVCVTSPRCVLVARSGVLILPKLFLGLPFTDITNMLQKDWIPEWLRARLVRFMTWIVHGDMTKLGFKPLNARAHVTSNATVVNHIAYRRIVFGLAGDLESSSQKDVTIKTGTNDDGEITYTIFAGSNVDSMEELRWTNGSSTGNETRTFEIGYINSTGWNKDVSGTVTFTAIFNDGTQQVVANVP